MADGWNSMGSAAAFVITGPSTKNYKLRSIKIALGVKHFIYYLLFCDGGFFATGIIINIVI